MDVFYTLADIGAGMLIGNMIGELHTSSRLHGSRRVALADIAGQRKWRRPWSVFLVLFAMAWFANMLLWRQDFDPRSLPLLVAVVGMFAYQFGLYWFSRRRR